MVSAMTFEKAVEVFGLYLRERGRTDVPSQTLLDFLASAGDPPALPGRQ